MTIYFHRNRLSADRESHIVYDDFDVHIKDIAGRPIRLPKVQ